jgi:hypothetical protein
MRILNLAIPIIYLFGLTVGMGIYLLVAQIATSMGSPQKSAEIVGGWASLIVIIALALAIARAKVNTLGPPTKDTSSGHMLLALGNTAALLTTVVPAALSYIKNYPNFMFHTWMFIPTFFFCLMFWIAGWKGATSKDEKPTQL